MSLTDAQLPTLKAAILAETDPAFVALRQANAEQGMADWYNADSTFVAWRTQVPRNDAQAVGFDWTQVDNLTVGQARIWFDALFEGGFLNAADSGQRAGISEAWKGTAAKIAVATFVLGKCKRFARRGERVFATGTGTDAAPGLLPFEGTLSAQDISDALRA
jgi:hypothetical protein